MVDEHIARLLWALPLVIALGCTVLVVLKRLGIDGSSLRRADEAPRVVSSTRISEHTTANVVEHQGRQYLVFESTAQLHVQAPPPNEQRWGSQWLMQKKSRT